MNRKPLLAIIAALGLGTATGSALAYDKSDIRAMEQAKITLEQAIERAQQQHSGSRALSAEIDMRRERAGKPRRSRRLIPPPMRVLLVEDDPMIGSAVRAALPSLTQSAA